MSRIIGLNTLFLIPNCVGGTENYTRTFIEELERNDRQNRYVVFCNEENFASFSFSHPNFKKVLCPIKATNRVARLLFEQLRLPGLIAREQCAVIHSFGYTGPLLSAAKKIVTIHDTNWKDQRSDIPMFSWIILSVLMEMTMRTADHIVTDSSFSRSRLLHFFPHLKSKLSVIIPWVGVQLLEEFSRRHQHPLKGKDYVLCVSGLYPHKKIPYLLDFIGDLPLVLVGKNGLDEPKVVARVKSMPNVTYYPKVALQTLAALYQHASVFVFPSVYEGFGYPVYEAGVLGLPTLVGKKDLYESDIRKHLRELTFDPSRDRVTLENMLSTQSDRKPHVYSQKQAVMNILRLYETI